MHCSESAISHTNRETLRGAGNFWQMRSAKGARDCSESAISHTNRETLRGAGHFWKMRSAKGTRDRELEVICQPHHYQVCI